MRVRSTFPWLAAAALLLAAPVQAQTAPSGGSLPGVTISGKATPDPVEKSYRRMVRGMDLFEREKARYAPQASLRFKVLPRKRDVRLQDLDLYVLGTTVEIPVQVAADGTFAVERNAKALQENAQVTPDRRALTMTWRAEVRTPGLPPGTRRLGDLRLECRVGMEAGLISNSPSWITRIVSAIDNTPAYCERASNQYLFFAERPVFGVTLVHGARREALPADRLWAGAVDDPRLRSEGLRFCDCEVLLDRTYYLPLADASWPDDTLVVFDFMEERDAPR
jgi:hypothetical protein